MPVIGTTAPVSVRLQAPAASSGNQHVIARGQCTSIGARDGCAGSAGVVRVPPHFDAADREKVAADVAVEIHAGVVLLVHHIGERDTELADGIARRVEHLRAEAENAAEVAARRANW